MKYIILPIVLLTISGCALAQPPTSSFTLKAIDVETGLPISNALARATFIEKEDPWGNGTGKFERQDKLTDKFGLATFKGVSYGPGGGGSIEAENYYQTIKGTNYSHVNLALNRWEPWNPIIEVKLRPKNNPVPMFYRERNYSAFKVPEYNQPIGYDLEKQSFVAPHGKGTKSDLFFEFRRDFENSQNFDVSCTMTFPNEHDGIQECNLDEMIQSSFKWPYLAATNNYQSTMVWRSTRADAKPVKHTFNEKVNYIFRVRTQTDENGSIFSACYGKIEGPFGLGWADKVNWVYWFNPVPNERSLEWNGVNLFKKK
jgi:hypothetical protein